MSAGLELFSDTGELMFSSTQGYIYGQNILDDKPIKGGDVFDFVQADYGETSFKIKVALPEGYDYTSKSCLCFLRRYTQTSSSKDYIAIGHYIGNGLIDFFWSGVSDLQSLLNEYFLSVVWFNI